MAKYYTPSIEEFHVGFEYEQRREIWNPAYPGIKVLEYIWEPVIGSLSSEKGGLYQFLEGINPDRKEKHYRFTDGPLGYGAYSNMVRVKYLDKTDIEELGFEESLDEPDEWFWKFKGNIDIQLYFDDKHRNKNQGIGITIYDDKIIFSGYIKNKSELKVLLKQLGING